MYIQIVLVHLGTFLTITKYCRRDMIVANLDFVSYSVSFVTNYLILDKHVFPKKLNYNLISFGNNVISIIFEYNK
jgi:putative flippase GtrA